MENNDKVNEIMKLCKEISLLFVEHFPDIAMGYHDICFEASGTADENFIRNSRANMLFLLDMISGLEKKLSRAEVERDTLNKELKTIKGYENDQSCFVTGETTTILPDNSAAMYGEY
jgi:hypothetical protein